MSTARKPRVPDTHKYSCRGYATLLRFCTDYAWWFSMLDETGFYAPSVAHNALPGRPWPGISVFLGHNSTVSKQLRYSPARKCVCAAGCPALTPLTLWQYFTILDLRFFSYWLQAWKHAVKLAFESYFLVDYYDISWWQLTYVSVFRYITYNKYSRSKYQRYLNLGGLCYNTIMP